MPLQRFRAIALVACAGCGQSASDDMLSRARNVPMLFDGGQGARIVENVTYDTLWTYGGDVSDTLLSLPLDIVATNQGVYVLDVQAVQVFAFDTLGHFRWAWGTRGQGPGEVQNLRAMSRDIGSDGVVLADGVNRRIVRLDDTGVVRDEVSLGDTPTGRAIEDVVPLASSRYILSGSNEGTAGPWPLVSQRGELEMFADVPWTGFITSSFLYWHGIATHWKDDKWVFVMRLGNGWFSFDGHLPLGTYQNIEHAPFPEIVVSTTRNGPTTRTRFGYIERPIGLVQAIEVVGDTMFVLPTGKTPHALRVLDRYHIPTGDYIASRELPGPTTLFSQYKQTLYVVDRTGLLPVISALHRKGD